MPGDAMTLEEPPALPADDAPLGGVGPPTVSSLPDGYRYGVTRYADVILQQGFPERFDDVCAALSAFRPTLDELRAGGGGRTEFVKRFDESLGSQRPDDQSVWGKQNITIDKAMGFGERVEPISTVRGHEIDMFGLGSLDQPFPGIAVEMEWNNKDPFFDRDLINFQALHREGAIAVGVIVTRGPSLQQLISKTIRSGQGNFKYGPSSTHWAKLEPRVTLGGGGECPLLLIGIEPGRIDGVQTIQAMSQELARLEEEEREALGGCTKTAIPDSSKRAEAKKRIQAEFKKRRNQVLDTLPPVGAERRR